MPDNISLLDLLDLPIPLRRIVRMVLREITMTYTQILRTLENLPESQRPDQNSTDTALDELTQRQLLIRYLTNSEATYRVNLAHRTPRSIDDNLWQKADFDSIERSERQWQPALQAVSTDGSFEVGEFMLRRGGKRTLPTVIWDSLEDKPKELTEAGDTEPPVGRGSLRNKLFSALDDI